MVYFSKIFFSKNSKNLYHFSKKSKKFRKKIASQINEFKSEDVSVSNGVLILKKAVKRLCHKLSQILSTIK
jgi:hypothetical protein